MGKDAYLILENGKVFCGKYFGYDGKVTGELVFTTAMTGYIETITDPSLYGHILIQTFPMSGNYGIIPEDFESKKAHLSALIVQEYCEKPSNFRYSETLDEYLKSNKVVGFYGIDPRELTKIVREYGVMNARISKSPDTDEKLLKDIKSFAIENAVLNVTSNERAIHKSKNGKYKIAFWDFGGKKSMINAFLKRDCDVYTFCASDRAVDIEALNPDGIFLSSGPGNPEDNADIIQQIKILAGKKIPIFAINLGHLLLALSQGANTVKMKYGHRGSNQPVKHKPTGRVYITAQNHGYSVDVQSLSDSFEIVFENANDSSIEGIRYPHIPALSVQFHPEACAGPLDTEFLFDNFIEMIEVNNNAVK